MDLLFRKIPTNSTQSLSEKYPLLIDKSISDIVGLQEVVHQHGDRDGCIGIGHIAVSGAQNRCCVQTQVLQVCASLHHCRGKYVLTNFTNVKTKNRRTIL